MKNYIRLLYLLLLPFIITLSSCEDDEETNRKGTYTNGVLVINEGLYLSGNGSISFISKDSSEISNNLFDKQNDLSLGSCIQSIGIHNDRLFVLANAANKVEVLNANDLKQLQAPLSGSDFNAPRYFASIGNTGYISCWGPYNAEWGLDDSYIAVFDLQNLTLIKKIPSAAGPEGIASVDSKVFVANSFTNTISVIVDNEIVKEIEVIQGPKQLLVDKNKDIWVVSNGGYITDGGIVRLNSSSYEVEKTYTTSGLSPSGSAAINGSKDRIYFISGAQHLNNTNIYTISINDDELPKSAFIEGKTFYGLGVDPSDGTIYVANSPSFIASGTVSRYKTTGEKIDEFTAGIGPSSFLFR